MKPILTKLTLVWMMTMLTPLTSSPFAAAAAAAAAAPSPKKPAVISDAEIERAIRARFNKSKIRADNFQVRVQGGVATIDGKTKVIQRKGVATRLAKLGGARAVENRIEIDEAARQRAIENLEKGRRRAQVKRSDRPRQAATASTAPQPAPGQLLR